MDLPHREAERLLTCDGLTSAWLEHYDHNLGPMEPIGVALPYRSQWILTKCQNCSQI